MIIYLGKAFNISKKTAMALGILKNFKSIILILEYLTFWNKLVSYSERAILRCGKVMKFICCNIFSGCAVNSKHKLQLHEFLSNIFKSNILGRGWHTYYRMAWKYLDMIKAIVIHCYPKCVIINYRTCFYDIATRNVLLIESVYIWVTDIWVRKLTPKEKN